MIRPHLIAIGLILGGSVFSQDSRMPSASETPEAVTPVLDTSPNSMTLPWLREVPREDGSPFALTLSLPRAIPDYLTTSFNPESWRLRRERREAGDIGEAERINERVMRLMRERWKRQLRSGPGEEQRSDDIPGTRKAWSAGV